MSRNLAARAPGLCVMRRNEATKPARPGRRTCEDCGAASAARRRTAATCAHCARAFRGSVDRVRQGLPVFCSRLCMDDFRRAGGDFGTYQKSAPRTHGQHGSKTHSSWAGMIQRCTNPKGRGFKDYGGRGISVCERWRSSFVDFLADMGERPEGKTLDRIDVNGNYEPGNCRWADLSTQSTNTRTCRLGFVERSQVVWLVLDGGHSRRGTAKAFGVGLSTVRLHVNATLRRPSITAEWVSRAIGVAS
jgi:hypothetical protein